MVNSIEHSPHQGLANSAPAVSPRGVARQKDQIENLLAQCIREELFSVERLEDLVSFVTRRTIIARTSLRAYLGNPIGYAAPHSGVANDGADLRTAGRRLTG